LRAETTLTRLHPRPQTVNVLDAYTLDSVRAGLNAFLSGERRPPLVAGVIAAAALVAACTAIIYPLKQITAVSSLGVVYLFGVVVVSAFCGVWLGSRGFRADRTRIGQPAGERDSIFEW
jgi:hypothetical protein